MDYHKIRKNKKEKTQSREISWMSDKGSFTVTPSEDEPISDTPENNTLSGSYTDSEEADIPAKDTIEEPEDLRDSNSSQYDYPDAEDDLPEEDPDDLEDDYDEDYVEDDLPNDEYLDEDDDPDDYEEEYEEKQGHGISAGEVLFRILAGFLILAIFITAATAVLLATGRLNGVIDSMNRSEETVQEEIQPEPTAVARVTLTPTPTVAPTEAPETKDSKETAAEDKEDSKKESAKDSATEQKKDSEKSSAEDKKKDAAKGEDDKKKDSSKAAEKSKDGTDVMTFKDVEEDVTAKETTNLRNVPSQGEESFIAYILQNGDIAKRTGISEEGWSRLEYNGEVVYAMSNLLTTDLKKKEKKDEKGGKTSEKKASEDENVTVQTKFTDVDDQVTPKEAVNLRKLPSVTNPKAEVVAKVKNGEVLKRTGINEELGWSRIEYKGETVYCISSYVETVRQ